MAEDIDASHTAGNAAATATPSMETATMADIDLSIDAPALPDVPPDDGGVGPISIDDIIVRIRAAHDQGMTIEDINHRLEALLTTVTYAKSPPLPQSEGKTSVKPPPPDANPAIDETGRERRTMPRPGSEVWQSTPARSKPSAENSPDQVDLPPRGASRDSHIPAIPRSSEHGRATCRTPLLHTKSSPSSGSLGNHGRNGPADCSTPLLHKRSGRRLPGLWRRGTIFQYRVRVPADVATVLGRRYISRSLRLDKAPRCSKD